MSDTYGTLDPTQEPDASENRRSHALESLWTAVGGPAGIPYSRDPQYDRNCDPARETTPFARQWQQDAADPRSHLPTLVPSSRWMCYAPDTTNMTPASKDGPYSRITLHHTGAEDTPEAVENLHRGHEGPGSAFRRTLGAALRGQKAEPYNWPDMGYHFLIGPDGTVYEGRSLDYQGSHVLGRNQRNIGIAFLGDYGDDRLPPEAVQSAKTLIARLNGAYHVQRNAQGQPVIDTHADLDPKGRPDELKGAGPDVDDIRRSLPANAP